MARETIDTMATHELEVRETENGKWHLMRVRPYKTWDNKIEGAVVSFQDIDALKRNLEVRHDFPRLGPRVMMLNARRIEPQPGRQMILLHIEDATGKKLN